MILFVYCQILGALYTKFSVSNGIKRIMIFEYRFFSDVDANLDWMLRHGRIVALFVALKECPHILLNDYADKIISTLISYISADRVSDRKVCVCVYVYPLQ